VLILSLGYDGGPSFVSGGRRFRVVGGRAVVVGTGGLVPTRGRAERRVTSMQVVLRTNEQPG
jgi:hypothetical protein